MTTTRAFVVASVAAAVVVAAVVACAFAACLPAGDVCCTDDVDCVQGARCFEGRCALKCDDDSQCAEGEHCDAHGAVCATTDAQSSSLERCPYHAPPRVP